MTITVRSHTNEHHYISLEIKTKYNLTYYEVQALPLYSDGTCGYPVCEMIYSIDEEKKALATFNRYKRKYI